MSHSERFGGSSGGRPSHMEEGLLHYVKKQHEYSRFLEDYKQIYSHDPLSRHYFLAVQNGFCDHIKGLKTSQYTVCES